MRLGRDGIAGLIGLAFSLALLPHAFGLPKLPIVPVGPGFYPSIVLVFMALTSAVLLLQDVALQRRSASNGTATAPETDQRPARAYTVVAAAFALVAVYIVLLPLVGFRLATVMFVAAFQVLLEPPTSVRKLAIQLAIAVATAAVTYLVFEHYLLVLMPRGSWTGW